MWLITFKNIKNNLLRMKKGMSFAALYFSDCGYTVSFLFLFLKHCYVTGKKQCSRSNNNR